MRRRDRGHRRRLFGVRAARRVQRRTSRATILQRAARGSPGSSDQLRRLGPSEGVLRATSRTPAERGRVGVRRARRHPRPALPLGKRAPRGPYLLEARRRVLQGEVLRCGRLRLVRRGRKRLGMGRRCLRPLAVSAGTRIGTRVSRRELESPLREVDEPQAAQPLSSARMGIPPGISLRPHAVDRTLCLRPKRRRQALRLRRPRHVVPPRGSVEWCALHQAGCAALSRG